MKIRMFAGLALLVAACGGNEPVAQAPSQSTSPTPAATTATTTETAPATVTTGTDTTATTGTTATTNTNPTMGSATATTTTTTTTPSTTAPSTDGAGSCVLTCEGTTKCVDNVTKADCEDTKKHSKIFNGIPRCMHKVAYATTKCTK